MTVFFRFILIIIVCCDCVWVKAQSYLYGQFQLGKVVPISPNYPPILHNAKAFQFVYEKHTTGKAPWHHLYRFPSIRWTLMYWDLGNEPVLGKVFMLQPIFNQTIFRAKNLNFYYQASLSFAYFSRHHHWIHNPTNTAVGSHINSSGYVSLGLGYQLLNNLRLEMTLGLSHFSNAHSSSPNIGVNVPAVSLAMGYKIKERVPNIKVRTNSLAHSKNKIYPAIRLGYGISEANTPSGPKYPVYTSAYFLNRNIVSIFRLRAGCLFFYSLKAQEMKQDLEEPNHGIQNRAVGLVAFTGGEILIGHVGLVLEGGWNFIKPFQMQKKIYTKLGLQFYQFDTQIHCRKQLYLGAYVHAHSGEADFAEMGIGYVF